MNDRVHGAGHVVLIIVGGDAHVLIVELQSEGVLRLPNGAVSPVQSQHIHEVVGKPPLTLHRVMAVEETVVGLLPVPDRMDHRHQPLPDNGKEAVQIDGVYPPLVLVEQCVVGSFIWVIIAGESPVNVHQLFQ